MHRGYLHRLSTVLEQTFEDNGVVKPGDEQAMDCRS